MADPRTSMPFPIQPRRVIDMVNAPASMPPGPAPQTAPVAATARRQESKLTVGKNIRLKGQISACDVLVVEGHVEASISCRLIEIAADGVFSGKAEVDTAEVHGRFEGELVVKQVLRLHAGGHVEGCIRYGTLEVASGGRLAGDIAMRGTDAAAAMAHPVAGDASNPPSTEANPHAIAG